MCYGCNKCNRCGKFDEDSLLYIPPPLIKCLGCGCEEVDPVKGICPQCGMPAAPVPGMSAQGEKAPVHSGVSQDSE